ncbi:MAG TPA: hypothetical protein VGS79_16990 [Puia sp.]|nr:hypothetical protein [Puia sp.]
MDKIFQILVVLALLMILVSRFIKGREPRFRPYEYIRRLKPPLPPDVEGRLIAALPGPPEGLAEGRVDMFISHDGLVFCYNAEGRLTIYRREGDKYRQRQELPVPLDCIAMALDPADEKLYFETGGFLFAYGN